MIFSRTNITMTIAEMTFAYIHALEIETNKVQKTQHVMVYSVDLSGSLSRTLAYIHASKRKPARCGKPNTQWFTMLT